MIIELEIKNNYENSRLNFFARKKLLGNKSEKKIVYVYDHEDYGTFRYRAFNLVEFFINNDSNYAATYFFTNEFLEFQDILDSIDILVLVRCAWSVNIHNLIRICKRNKVKIIYDTDDLVIDSEFSVKLIQNLGTFNHSREWFGYVSERECLAEQCDLLSVTNQYLANILSQKYDKQFLCIPNSLNKLQLSVSEKIVEEKNRIKDNFTDVIWLGYFSGTSSHNNDFSLIAYELEQLLIDHEQFRLRIVGFLDIPINLRRFVGSKIEVLPLMTFERLQLAIAECDINLIPLQQNVFTNCKSELKFFESAIVETISIASPTFVYTNIPDDYIFIAEDGNWYSTILNVVNLGLIKMDKKARAAKSYALDEYSGKKYFDKLLNTYESID